MVLLLKSLAFCYLYSINSETNEISSRIMRITLHKSLTAGGKLKSKKKLRLNSKHPYFNPVMKLRNHNKINLKD